MRSFLCACIKPKKTQWITLFYYCNGIIGFSVSPFSQIDFFWNLTVFIIIPRVKTVSLQKISTSRSEQGEDGHRGEQHREAGMERSSSEGCVNSFYISGCLKLTSPIQSHSTNYISSQITPHLIDI